MKLDSDEVTVSCPDCHGRGIVEGKNCKTCDGYGETVETHTHHWISLSEGFFKCTTCGKIKEI